MQSAFDNNVAITYVRESSSVLLTYVAFHMYSFFAISSQELLRLVSSGTTGLRKIL